MPCTAIYKHSVHGKNSTGKDGYQIIGNNLLMYDPTFDKNKEKRAQDELTGQSQLYVPMREIFNDQNIAGMGKVMTRNSMGGPYGFATQQDGNALNTPLQPIRAIHRQNSTFGLRKELNIKKDVGNQGRKTQRPQTSYSHSRKGLSTQSQSRNLTKSNFHATNSQQSNLIDPLAASSVGNFSGANQQTRNGHFLSMATEQQQLKQNSLRGCEIQNIAGEQQVYENYHQPRENTNIQSSYRENDPLINGEQFIMPQGRIKRRRPRTTAGKGDRRSASVSKRGVASAAIQDLKKSVGLLQAYGEFDRFIEISKKFMNDRGIPMNKKLSFGAGGIATRNKKRKSKRKIQLYESEGAANLRRAASSQCLKERESSPGDDKKYEEMDKILNDKLSKTEVIQNI